MRHVTSDHVVIHRQMIEVMDGVPVADRLGQFGLPAAEIADDVPTALLAHRP